MEQLLGFMGILSAFASASKPSSSGRSLCAACLGEWVGASACRGHEMVCKGCNLGDLATNMSARADVTSVGSIGSGSCEDESVCFSDELLDSSERQRQKRQRRRQFRKARTAENGEDLGREAEAAQQQIRSCRAEHKQVAEQLQCLQEELRQKVDNEAFEKVRWQTQEVAEWGPEYDQNFRAALHTLGGA